jgi:hypothetical protein
MRLRKRAVAADWLGPCAHTWTTVGSLGSTGRAAADPRGLVTPGLGGWSLDWWIGADDRWHLPSQDPAVRQRLVDNTPVVETAMRVPGGDAVQRVYGVPGAGGGFVVVEIENRSPVPFALALAIRPYNPDGPAVVKRIRFVDDAATVDGRPAVLFQKRPARMAGSTFEQGDVADVVTSGAAGDRLPEPLKCEAGLATAAFIFPLAHTATLRVALPLSPRRRGRVQLPSRLPSSADVVRGWKAQSSRGMRLELPPGRVADAVEANRRFMLLFEEDPSPNLSAGDGPVQQAFTDLANGDHRALDRLQSFLDASTDTFTWPPGHDRRAAHDLVSFVQALLVREAPDEAGAALVLCSMLPEAWAGQPLEVHDAPTQYGNAGFAVRWHGERPALLWELERHAGVGPVRLSAPGLDPAWATIEPRGEALLQPRDTRPGPSRSQETFS